MTRLPDEQNSPLKFNTNTFIRLKEKLMYENLSKQNQNNKVSLIKKTKINNNNNKRKIKTQT